MQLYSTNSPDKLVSLKEAVMKGLPADNGLFMPDKIPVLSDSFINNLKDYTFQEIAYIICESLFNNIIPANDLKSIIHQSITFPAPLIKLDDKISILELFHGPSLAFKDFGARFMAQLMSYFNQGNNKELVILVATSGDTGGAVASGFYKTPGIKVVILYPSGKVSPLQEKQLTTLGNNITALEVKGTFDDCQDLVKKAFLNQELTQLIQLSSANSINIARLIPQTFYYFEAYKQIVNTHSPIAFCVPSGNFGNLTAGLIAKKMGLPIDHFIAATNSNNVVPVYLKTGKYIPKSSVRTISNAMDVGNPSNFNRMLDIYCSTWNIMKEEISGYSYNDEQTKLALQEVFEKYQYVIDPHAAVGYLALKEYHKKHPNTTGVILETAHASKFKEDVESILKQKIDIPERLNKLASLPKQSIPMSTSFQEFHSFLLNNYANK